MPTSPNAKVWRVSLLNTGRIVASGVAHHLPDFRTQLSATDYGNFLANEPLPISTATITEKATQILVDQFNYLRSNAVAPLSKFLDYITFVSAGVVISLYPDCEKYGSYAYMIDNVVLLITGTLHERDTHELLERCHPLGVFDTMPALCVATNVEELYQSVLVETPLGALIFCLFRLCPSFCEISTVFPGLLVCFGS